MPTHPLPILPGDILTERAILRAEPWRDPAQRAYRPRGAALELWRTRAAEVLLEGPSGTGKTRAVLEKAYLVAMKYPGARVLLVRKTRASCTQSILVIFEQHVCEQNAPCLAGADRQTRASYLLPNGSEIVLAGLDTVERIMSAEYDMVCAFEATELTEDDWEKLLTRLRGAAMPYRQAIADCNPGPPTHWLNQRAQRGLMLRLFSRHSDNPSVTAEYLAALDRLTGVRRARLYLGQWVVAEGVVYDGFDAALHVVGSFDIPADWRRMRAVDFGFEHPFVCQWWAADGDGRLYLYRELYGTHRLVSDWAADIVRLSAEEDIEYTIADHDSDGRETLNRAGIPTIPARKDVSLGIQAVADRLRIAADGRPRLALFRQAFLQRDSRLTAAGRAGNTAEEFARYSWERAISGQPKDVPLKVDDHGLDALRYLVVQEDVVTRLLVAVG